MVWKGGLDSANANTIRLVVQPATAHELSGHCVAEACGLDNWECGPGQLGTYAKSEVDGGSVNRDSLFRGTLPAKLAGALQAAPSEFFGGGAVFQNILNGGSQGRLILGWDEEGRPRRNFWKAGGITGHNRRSCGHRFQHRQSKSLI